MGKYALLFSGGVNEKVNNARYGNNIGFMYEVLKRKYNYNNVKVIYSDGRSISYAGSTINTEAATLYNIEESFIQYKDSLTEDDVLFIMISNHGGLNINGAYTHIWGDTDIIFHNQLSVRLNELKGTKVILLGQCYGGNLLDNNINNSILISGNEPNKLTYARQGLQYDEFLYHFISYFNHNYPDGSPLSCANDILSIEAGYTYAKTNDEYYKNSQILTANKSLLLEEIPQIKCTGCDPAQIYL